MSAQSVADAILASPEGRKALGLEARPSPREMLRACAAVCRKRFDEPRRFPTFKVGVQALVATFEVEPPERFDDWRLASLETDWLGLTATVAGDDRTVRIEVTR